MPSQPDRAHFCPKDSYPGNNFLADESRREGRPKRWIASTADAIAHHNNTPAHFGFHAELHAALKRMAALLGNATEFPQSAGSGAAPLVPVARMILDITLGALADTFDGYNASSFTGHVETLRRLHTLPGPGVFESLCDV